MWKSIRHLEQAPEVGALDDRIGADARNPIKKWWLDLEVIDGIAVTPPAGTNEHDLDLDRMRLALSQRRTMFPVELMLPPGSTKREVYPVDRAAGIRRYEEVETPEAARLRLA